MSAWNWAVPVRARILIRDNPLAEVDATAPRGAIGWIQDEADGYLWVDFGKGAISCFPDEVRPATRKPR